jgi:hypothetical protein
MRGERLYTARQAAKALDVRYLRLLYALNVYSPRQFERYQTRLVTIRECEWALAQVQKTGQRASAQPASI